MTPEEKARELIEKYAVHTPSEYTNRQCAIIECNGRIEEIKYVSGQNILFIDGGLAYNENERINYWQQVLSQLKEKL